MPFVYSRSQILDVLHSRNKALLIAGAVSYGRMQIGFSLVNQITQARLNAHQSLRLLERNNRNTTFFVEGIAAKP